MLSPFIWITSLFRIASLQNSSSSIFRTFSFSSSPQSHLPYSWSNFSRPSSQRPFPSLAVSTLGCSHLFTQCLSLLSQQWVLISLSGYELFMCPYNLPYPTSLTLFSHFLPLSLHIASFQVANMFTVKATLTQLCLKLLLHYFLSTTKFIFNFITISNIQKHGIPIYLYLDLTIGHICFIFLFLKYFKLNDKHYDILPLNT